MFQPSDINQTISTALGGTYVNDFIDRGRVKRCMFRRMPNSVCCQKMSINFMSAAPTAKWCHSRLYHFTLGVWLSATGTLQRSAVNGDSGEAAPGTSSGDAMALMENLASKLPAGIGYDWTGMSYQGTFIGKPGSRSGSNFLCGCFPEPCCTL